MTGWARPELRQAAKRLQSLASNRRRSHSGVGQAFQPDAGPEGLTYARAILRSGPLTPLGGILRLAVTQ